MSPEQAKGRAADKRSDIWAFGCVFYEMLTGRRAFDGEDIGDTLANVLKSHPDLGVLPRTAPTWVRTLIACALEKDRHRRVADVSALRFMLDHGDMFSAPEASSRLSKRRTWPLVVSASALAALIASVVVWNLRRSPSSATPLVTRLSIAVPSSQPLLGNELAVALSPDGRMLVFRHQFITRSNQHRMTHGRCLIGDALVRIGQPWLAPGHRARRRLRRSCRMTVEVCAAPNGETSS
jgi:serine/threonine protein kinase